VTLAMSGGNRLRWRAVLERARESPVETHSSPLSGTYRPGFNAVPTAYSQLGWEGAMSRVEGRAGSTWDLLSALSVVREETNPARTAHTYSRARIEVGGEQGIAIGTIALRLTGASTFGASVPAQRQVLFGGPVTAPGYDTHALRGTSGVSARGEWRIPVMSFPLSLGRFGSTRVPVLAVPFAQGAWLAGTDGVVPPPAWYRTAGLGIVSLHDLLRLDVYRGVDRGGRWGVRLDFGKAFWPIL